MLKKITKVKSVSDALNNSIICCRQIDEDGNDSYKFLTAVESFIQYCEENEKKYFDDEMGYGTYDVLNNESLDSIYFPGFLGEIFSVVSLQSPKYTEYLSEFDTEGYSVDFNEDVYYLHEFKKVLPEKYSLFNSKGQFKDSDENSPIVVSNFSKDDFSETYGYLYLGEKTGVKFLSERAFLNLDDIKKESLGLKEKDGDKFLVLKILLISLADNIVDFIAINDSETVVPEESSEDEYVFVEPDIVSYDVTDDVEDEADDWEDTEDVDDMDEEFDVEIDVIESIRKKDNLDHIDDIDDDIDVGDL